MQLPKDQRQSLVSLDKEDKEEKETSEVCVVQVRDKWTFDVTSKKNREVKVCRSHREFHFKHGLCPRS